MRNDNTFGLHFILRIGRAVRDKCPIYAKITVNKTKCELALKCQVRKEDWNIVRGSAKLVNEDLRLINSYLEEGRGKLVKQYRALQDFDNSMLERVRDLFVFSFYTGLAYIDLTDLKPQEIIASVDGIKWIKTVR